MSWIERSIEQRLAEAVAAGELDTPHLKGKQLDLDTNRRDGWWAERFVRRERSHDRRQVALAAADEARVGFWRASTTDQVCALVDEANEAIATANINLVEDDQLTPFDADDIVARWRALHRKVT